MGFDVRIENAPTSGTTLSIHRNHSERLESTKVTSSGPWVGFHTFFTKVMKPTSFLDRWEGFAFKGATFAKVSSHLVDSQNFFFPPMPSGHEFGHGLWLRHAVGTKSYFLEISSGCRVCGKTGWYPAYT